MKTPLSFSVAKTLKAKPHRLDRLVPRIAVMALGWWTVMLAQSSAVPYSWNVTAGGTYTWTTNTNWLPNTAFPDSAGDQAILTNDITGAVTVNFAQDIALQGLTLGDFNNSHSFTVASAANFLNFTGDPSVLIENGSLEDFINAKVNLASQVRVTTNGTLTINGMVSINGPNGGVLEKEGGGTLNLAAGLRLANGPNNDLRVTNGTINIYGNSATLVKPIVSNGADGVVLSGGTTNFYSRTTTMLTNIDMDGGTLNFGSATAGAITDVSFTSLIQANTSVANSGATTIVVADVVNLAEGMEVTGLGIAPGTTIDSIDPATNTITLSQPTTAPGPIGTVYTFGTALEDRGGLVISGGTVNFGRSSGTANVSIDADVLGVTGGRLNLQNGNGGGTTTIGSGALPYLFITGNGYVSVYNDGNANGTVVFAPDVGIFLDNTATFEFHDRTATDDLVQNDTTIASLYSDSSDTTLRSAAGSSKLFVNSSGTGVNRDIFNGVINFSGSTSNLVMNGTGELEIGGNKDNNTGRFEVLNGTLIFAKASNESVHAAGSLVTIGDNVDPDVETLRLGGTFSEDIGSFSFLNYVDQIYRGVTVTINASGVLDMAGKSEGINGLTGGAAVGGAAQGKVTNSGTELSLLSIGDEGGSSTWDGVIEDGAGQIELWKTGGGTFTIRSAQTYSGRTLVGRGTLTLTGSAGTLLNSSVIEVASGATLLVSNNGAGNSNANRFGNNAKILLNNGTLTIRRPDGTGQVPNGTTVPVILYEEQVGILEVTNGQNVLRIDHATDGGSGSVAQDVRVRISIADYVRQAGGQVSVVEDADTGSPNVAGVAVNFFNADNANLGLSQLVIRKAVADISTSVYRGASTDLSTSATSGNPNKKILLGMFGGTGTNNNTGEFMTIETIGGINYIRPLRSSEYRASNSTVGAGLWDANSVRSSNLQPVGNGNTAYNATADDNLLVNANLNVAILAGGTATSASGTTNNNYTPFNQLRGHVAVNSWKQTTGIVTINENNVVHLGTFAGDALHRPGESGAGTGMMLFTGTSVINGGTLDFGTLEAIMRANAAVTFRTRLTGTGGMNITGGGLVSFMGDNNLTGNIYIGQGTVALSRDTAFGPASAIDRVIMDASVNLILQDGINVAARALTIGEGSNFRAIDRNNSWNADITVSPITETGVNANAFISIVGDATLTINGDVSGGGKGVNPTYNAVGNRRQLVLQGFDTVTNLSNGVIKINGELSDYNGGAATNVADRLDIIIRGQNGGSVFRNDFNVFLANTAKLNGQLDIRNGFVHIGSNYGGTGDPDSAALPTNNLVVRMKDSAGVDTPNGITGVFMSQAGSKYYTQSIVFGETNTVDFNRHTYALVGGTNTSGTVTYGWTATSTGDPTDSDIGTGTFDIGNDQNTENKNTAGVTVAGTNTITLANVTGLRVGMALSHGSVPTGTIITAINGNVITLSSKLTADIADAQAVTFPLRAGVANDNIAEARLYARAGGTVDFKMRFIDDGGDSLVNEVGILSKIGRGTVSIWNSTAGTGDIDGGVHINGGTLHLRYDNGTNMTKINSTANARVPLIMAGGTLFVEQVAGGLSHTENIRGELMIRSGGSSIIARELSGTLNLVLGSNLATDANPFHMPFRYAGGTVDFIERGGADIFYGVKPAAASGSTVPLDSVFIPYATILTGNVGTPVHDFAVLDFSVAAGANIPINSASNLQLYANQATGTATFTPNVSQWNTNGYLNVGYFSENRQGLNGGTEFTGAMASSYVGVRAIRFNVNKNASINQAGFDLVLGRNQSGASTDDGGAILITEDVTTGIKTIEGGNITSMLRSTYFNAASSPLGDSSGMGSVGGASSSITTPGAASNATSTDLIVHHYGGAVFEIKSNIVNSSVTNPGYYGASIVPLNFVHAGIGTTHLTGNNTYTGSTYVGGGTLWISSISKLGVAPASVDADSIFLNGGVLEFADDTNRSTGAVTVTIEDNRGITLGGNAGTIRVTAAGSTVTYGGILKTEDNALPYYLGAGTTNSRDTNLGVGDFLKEGLGRMILTNATAAPAEFIKTGGWNAYYGLTEIKAGTLQVNIGAVANSGILGSNWTTIDGTIVYSGARLDVQMDASGTGSTQEWITLENGATLGTTAAHGTGTLNGVMQINGDVTFDIVAGLLRLNEGQGYISGAGNIKKTGAGNLVLSENNSDFTGNWEILQGEVRARSQGTPLGKGTSIILGDNVNASANGTTAGLYLMGRQTNFTSEYSVLRDITVRREVSGSVTQTKEIGVRNVDGTIFTGMNNDRYVFGTSTSSITLEDDLTLAYRDSLANAQLAPAAAPGTADGSGTTGEYRYVVLAGQMKNAVGDLTRHNVSTLVEMSGAGTRRVFATFELQNDNSGWLGDLAVGNAVANDRAQHIVRLSNNNALTGNNNVSLGYDAKLQVGGKTVTIGNLTTPVIGTGDAALTNRIVVENASTSAGTLTINQATGTTAAPVNWNALFQDGTTPAVYASSGTAAVYSNSLSVVKAGAGVAVMSQNNTYTGTTSVAAGNLQVGIADVGRTGNGGTSVESGATLSGTGTVDGFYSSDSFTFTTTANTAVATVGGNPLLLKVGMVVNNANFAGGTARIGAISGNVITFDKIATASGAAPASTVVATQHRIKSGGTLSPGDLGGTGRGSLSITGALTLDSGSTTRLELGASPTRNFTQIGGNLSDLTVGSANYATAITNITNVLRVAAPGDHDSIQITGSLSASAGSNFTVVNSGASLDLGNVYNLLDWSAVNFGTFSTGGAIRAGGSLGDLVLPTLAGNLMWDTSRFTTEGLLIVVNGVPEPSRAMLMIFALGALVLRRRRAV